MSDYAYELAGLIRKEAQNHYNSAPKTGMHLAKLVQVTPEIKLSMMNGEILIDKDIAVFTQTVRTKLNESNMGRDFIVIGDGTGFCVIDLKG